MVERLLILLILAAIGSGIYLAYKQVHLRHLHQLPAYAQQPTLLYFWSDSCSACPAQTHYLDELTRLWNDQLVIQTINAEVEPEKTAHFRVFTLPTTILIDELGQVRQVNYGVTNTQKLLKQLEAIFT